MNTQYIVLGIAWTLAIFYVVAWHKLPRLVSLRSLAINLVASGAILLGFYNMPQCATLFPNACQILFIALLVAMCNFWSVAAMLLFRLWQSFRRALSTARR